MMKDYKRNGPGTMKCFNLQEKPETPWLYFREVTSK